MSMLFRQIDSTRAVADYLAKVIFDHLNLDQKVLWLVPGGSAIGAAIEVSEKLKSAGLPLKNLTVSLTDERYGHVGHDDSNWRQLEQAGFKLDGAKPHPVLIGQPMAETVEQFDQFLGHALTESEYRLGFFGMGADGHTAGILPGSSATESKDLVAGYRANYERITMTFNAILKLDEAVVYAVGEDKWPALDNLDKDLALSEQPAQILKQVSELIIFNDHKGDKV